jgi:O-antigen/teichoic acid export membrane protein
MAQVAQPVLTNVDDEEGRQQRVFRKMLRFTAFVCFPLMFGLALVAHEFIIVTIGMKWESCVILLQILWKTLWKSTTSFWESPELEVYQNLLWKK